MNPVTWNDAAAAAAAAEEEKKKTKKKIQGEGGGEDEQVLVVAADATKKKQVDSSDSDGHHKEIQQDLHKKSTTNSTVAPIQNRMVSNNNIPVMKEWSIYVQYLSNVVNEKLLLEVFSARYPSCIGVRIGRDGNQNPRGYGFVKFSNIEECNLALKEMNGFQIAGKPIRVSLATRTSEQMNTLKVNAALGNHHHHNNNNTSSSSNSNSNSNSNNNNNNNNNSIASAWGSQSTSHMIASLQTSSSSSTTTTSGIASYPPQPSVVTHVNNPGGYVMPAFYVDNMMMNNGSINNDGDLTNNNNVPTMPVVNAPQVLPVNPTIYHLIAQYLPSPIIVPHVPDNSTAISSNNSNSSNSTSTNSSSTNSSSNNSSSNSNSSSQPLVAFQNDFQPGAMSISAEEYADFMAGPRSSIAVLPVTDPLNHVVFVGNLPSLINETDIKNHFKCCGEISSIEFFLDSRCCLITFSSREEAENAISIMHGSILGENRIRVDWGRSSSKQSTGNVTPNSNSILYGMHWHQYLQFFSLQQNLKKFYLSSPAAARVNSQQIERNNFSSSFDRRVVIQSTAPQSPRGNLNFDALAGNGGTNISNNTSQDP